jgi:hypothetical protein
MGFCYSVQVDLGRASGADVLLTVLSLTALGEPPSSDEVLPLIAHLNHPDVSAQLSGAERQALQLLGMAKSS